MPPTDGPCWLCCWTRRTRFCRQNRAASICLARHVAGRHPHAIEFLLSDDAYRRIVDFQARRWARRIELVDPASDLCNAEAMVDEACLHLVAKAVPAWLSSGAISPLDRLVRVALRHRFISLWRQAKLRGQVRSGSPQLDVLPAPGSDDDPTWTAVLACSVRDAAEDLGQTDAGLCQVAELWLDGGTESEIAAQLGLALPRARALMQRARKTLRDRAGGRPAR